MTNNTNNTIKGTLRDEYLRGILPIALIGFILTATLLLAIIGNLTVILAVQTTHRLKMDKANMFIVNLAVTDLGMGTIVMTSVLVSLVQNEWTMGHIWCNIVCAANYCFIIVSMLTLSFISIDRYISIRYALDYQVLVTKCRILCAIAYTWFQGIVFAMVPMIEDWIIYDYWEIVCAINWQHKEAINYVIVAFVVCFLVPGCILIYCYSHILGKASQMKATPKSRGRILSKQQTNLSLNPQAKMRAESAKRAIRSLLIVILAFFICMTPFSVTKLLKVIYPYRKIIPPYINVAASIIGYFSSASNPLIYGIFRKDFRIAFKITFRRVFCPHKPLDPNLGLTTMMPSIVEPP